MALKKFGTMPDGTEIVEFVIGTEDLSAKIINFGAIIRDVRLAGVAWPLVLGFDNLEDYLRDSSFIGAVVGRHANRIAAGHMAIDGVVWQLSLNENGRTHLHGGFIGFSKRAWRVVDHDGRSVTLAITAADGEEGYPGTVEAICRYSLEPPATIRVEFEATTDAPTLVNLAQHSYFNLGGDENILDHRVMIHADCYTPVDGDKIPTGEIAAVMGTEFDFRETRPIRRAGSAGRVEYDINFVKDEERSDRPRPVAHLESPTGDVALLVASTEPGVQFFDGGALKEIAQPGLDGRLYGSNAGCCFEPQLFPDSVHHPGFPSPILKPGDTYRQTTLFSFSRR